MYQSFQSFLLWVGYFNRFLSVSLFAFILFALFFCYFLILYKEKRSNVSASDLKLLILGSACILFFAYTAFSHDLFNYMFDARIVTKYSLNPYEFTALQFPDDLWVRFMHWTHRTYPYGPVWLVVTLPFSFIGSGKFVLTFVFFKLLFILAYLGNSLLTYQILKKISPKQAYRGLILFALNPLILIETLVSPHNESLMLFFLLGSLYVFFVVERKILAIGFMLLSIGVKFITFLPALPLFLSLIMRKSLTFKTYMYLALIMLGIGIGYEIYIREPYPWYFVMLIGILALLPTRNSILFITTISISSLLRYIPYLLIGDYSLQTARIQDILFWVPLVFMSMYLIKSFLRKYHIKQA